jgi:hypothetical protein
MNSEQKQSNGQSSNTSSRGQRGARLVILGAGESGVGAALLGMQKGWDVFVSDGGRLKDEYKSELDAVGIAYEEGGILNLECSLPIASSRVPAFRKRRRS